MSVLLQDFSKVKNKFKFLFFEHSKVFCDFNFLALPFYFGKTQNVINYYRFEGTIINYTKLKNSSSFYLVFRLNSTYSLKIRSDNLFEFSSFNFANIFSSKKYYGYLLHLSFN